MCSLIGKSNNPIATLGTLDNRGTLILGTESSEGEFRGLISLITRDDCGAMEIYSKTNQPAVTLRVDENGNGEIGAWSKGGEGKTLRPGP